MTPRGTKENGEARRRGAGKGSGEALGFTAWTAGFGGAGLGAVLLGLYLLGQGSISLAPLLLVVGFLVFVPLALVR